MFQLRSLGEYVVVSRGQCFSVESPVACERNLAAFREALGDFTVDGDPYELLGLESFAVLRPLRVGELIGLLVKRIEG